MFGNISEIQLIFILFGAVFLLIGIIFFIYSKILSGNTQEFTGTVVDFLPLRTSSKYTLDVSCPVAEYEHNGKIIRANYCRYLTPEEMTLKAGQTVKIFINPKMPKTFRFETDKDIYPVKTYSIMAVIGLAALIIGIII